MLIGHGVKRPDVLYAGSVRDVMDRLRAEKDAAGAAAS